MDTRRNTSNYKTSVNKWNAKRRTDVLTILGGKCIKCGFSDPRALQIDHVDGNGCVERKAGKGTLQLQAEIIKTKNITKKYQLLCANCNWIKRHENYENRNGNSPNKFILTETKSPGIISMT